MYFATAARRMVAGAVIIPGLLAALLNSEKALARVFLRSSASSLSQAFLKAFFRLSALPAQSPLLKAFLTALPRASASSLSKALLKAFSRSLARASAVGAYSNYVYTWKEEGVTPIADKGGCLDLVL